MSYRVKLLLLTCAGFSLRLVIMPFTMHGQDLFFINYFPMMWMKEGIWDVYGFIAANFAHFPATYYGPALFFIMAIPNLIYIKLFHAAPLVKMLEASSAMMGGNLTTSHYARAFFGHELFRNLFLMKAPYLIFDFWIGFILLKLAMSEKSGLFSYGIWMFNAVVLHSIYAIGQADIITAFFIVSALYAAVRGRPYASVALLALGGATKLYPYFLILPACILLGDTWKKRVRLIFTGLLISIALYLPFYLSSGSSVLGYFVSSKRVGYTGGIKLTMTAVFFFFYCLLLNSARRDSKTAAPAGKLIYYFASILFLSYACFSIRFRYLVYAMPLAALVIPQHRRFGLFILLVVFIEAFTGLTTRQSQFGLLAPLNPEYFLALPALQEVISRVVDITTVYKVMFRVLLLALFASAWWAWRVRINKCLINRASI